MSGKVRGTNEMEIIQYSESKKNIWNTFNKKSKNGLFLFNRDYMDYHSDRFKDHSLCVYNEKKRLIALLPANELDGTLFSHQGLTFGGFIIGKEIRTFIMLEVFNALLSYLKKKGFHTLQYKPSPYIYHKEGAQNDLYALFKHKAQIVQCDLTTTIYLQEQFKYSKGRKWTINKAKKESIDLCESNDYLGFWKLLSQILDQNHAIKPVHSLHEIQKLSTLFKSEIRLFLAKKKGAILAGALIYENDLVAHTQYLANSEKGRTIGALDLLIDHLINVVFKEKKYFNFGASTEDGGQILNKGLVSQKEGFGGRGVVQQIYEVSVC